jgi:probable rRNA maturation factor
VKTSKWPRLEIIVLSRRKVPRKRALELSLKLFKIFAGNKRVKRCKSRHPEIPDLTLSFVDRADMKKLNKRYRGKDYATDVLSFSPEEKALGLGELVFCAPVLERQAREHDLSFRREMDYLIIHGFLHLLGYDHERSRKEELKMMNLQDKLFEKLQ